MVMVSLISLSNEHPLKNMSDQFCFSKSRFALLPVVLIVLVLAPFSKVFAEGETLLDWAAFNEGKKAESGIVGNVCFSHLYSEHIRLVDASTNPASPFSAGAAGFYFDIDSTGAPQARIWIKTAAAEKKGWVEVPFQIVEGGFSVNLDTVPVGDEKVPASFISLKPPVFAVSVEISKLRAGPTILKTTSGATVGQGIVHKLRIAWNTTENNTLQFEMSLDGEVVLGQGGDPILKMTGEKTAASSDGINIISLKSKQKEPNKFFLGTVQASGK